MNVQKRLFVVSEVFHDGHNTISYAYYAFSKLEVAQRLLTEMSNGTEEGLLLRTIFLRMYIPSHVYTGDDSCSYDEDKSNHIIFIMTRTPQELIGLTEQQCLKLQQDETRVFIKEINMDNVVDLSEVKTNNIDVEITIDNIDDIVGLINCAFRDYEVSHLIWNGKSWYSHTVYTWREHRFVIIGEVGDHDPDHICYGYFKHSWINHDCPNSDPNIDEDDENDVIPYEQHKVEDIEDIKHVFVRAKFDPLYDLKTKIDVSHDIYIMNDMGFNADHRGSNHMNIEIDHLFEGNVVIRKGNYTFEDLANLIWRCKANKFDNQYECVFQLSSDNVERDENDDYHVNLIVDHGS